MQNCAKKIHRKYIFICHKIDFSLLFFFTVEKKSEKQMAISYLIEAN